MTEPTLGERFSQNYMRETSLLPDSARMRRRLGAIYGDYEDRQSFGQTLKSELGIQLPQYFYSHQWPPLMGDLDLRDVLDSVTIRWRLLERMGQSGGTYARAFAEKARRVFEEEQVRYRIDDQGGVHFSVDADFESNRIATIASLGKSRYSGVRLSYEEAFAALDRTPPDGKAAVRSAFFAVECLFRLMYPTAIQLSGFEITKHLKTTVDKIFAGQKPAIYVAQKQVSAFIDWVDGSHFYRHEPGSEEPSQPPLSLAIYMTAQAGAHLRWLVGMDEN